MDHAQTGLFPVEDVDLLTVAVEPEVGVVPADRRIRGIGTLLAVVGLVLVLLRTRTSPAVTIAPDDQVLPRTDRRPGRELPSLRPVGVIREPQSRQIDRGAIS